MLIVFCIAYVSIGYSQDYLVQNKQPKPDPTPGFYFKEASDYLLGSVGCAAMSAAVFVAGASIDDNDNLQKVMYGVGAGFGIASIAFQLVGYLKIADAGKLMMKLEDNEKVNITLQPTGNGVGFVCRLK